MTRFGTDGIRGPAGEYPITPRGGWQVGRAAARLAERGGGTRVLVGRDTRTSGPLLEEAVVRGIHEGGCAALRAGVVPTSALSTALAEGLGEVAVMITASHNEASDNGFKILTGGGRKLSDEEVALFEHWLDAAEPAETFPPEDGSIDVLSCYLDRLFEAAGSLDALDGRRIAVDLANGAATVVAHQLRTRLPAEVLFVGVDGGAINDRCGAMHTTSLAELVRRHRCDAGLAVDGDADRCVLVDERGSVVPGDALIWFLARRLEIRHLAVTVMSTVGLEAQLPETIVERTPVGDVHLQRAIGRGAQLGGEESGHVLFQDGLPTGDGLLTGLRALARMAVRGAPFSRQLSEFEIFPRRTTKVAAHVRPPLDSIPELVDACLLGEAEIGSDGRIFLRYSGTEPVLRILVEGPDPDTVAEVSTTLTRIARESLA